MSAADLPAVLAMAQAALERAEEHCAKELADYQRFGIECVTPGNPRCDCDVCAASQTLDACREARDRLAGVA